MPKILTLSGCGLMLLVLSCSASQAGELELKQTNNEVQVAVLLKWYHDYSEKGKHEQACRVAELAYEMAPENPETRVAVKLAHRQRNAAASASNSDRRLEQILVKLERIDKRLYAIEARKRQSAQFRSLYREPPGSPDGPD
jgi:hypothetical protein